MNEEFLANARRRVYQALQLLRGAESDIGAVLRTHHTAHLQQGLDLVNEATDRAARSLNFIKKQQMELGRLFDEGGRPRKDW